MGRKRKRLHNDIPRMKAIIGMLEGCEVPSDILERIFPRAIPGSEWARWDRRTTPARPFLERTYAAWLFVRDLKLAITVAQQTTGIREAARIARAMQALQEASQ